MKTYSWDADLWTRQNDRLIRANQMEKERERERVISGQPVGRNRRERERERPIVRSMREEIGDSISTQMSRGQIFPGSGPWRLGAPLWEGVGIGFRIKPERRKERD